MEGEADSFRFNLIGFLLLDVVEMVNWRKTLLPFISTLALQAGLFHSAQLFLPLEIGLS
jgi:hypothetical protein